MTPKKKAAGEQNAGTTNQSHGKSDFFRRGEDHLENEASHGHAPAIQSPTSMKRIDREPLCEVKGAHRGRQIYTFDQGRVSGHGRDLKTGDHIGFSPTSHFDDAEKEVFELMNIRIVVYGLTGVMCEKELVKKKRFGKKENAVSAMPGSVPGNTGAMGPSTSSISSADVLSLNEIDCLENQSIPTTAVVSCQKNAISSQTALETFLPSMPLHRPVAAFVNKVRYVASWPSEQSSLRIDDGVDLSSFKVIRCMKQAVFIPGAGVGSNYVHETIELGINLSRGTEMIRLGTASLIVGGEEEGEVSMNVPAKPFATKSKKFTKKKNKYGYFSNDPLRRYYLDENAAVRVGVQVIPETTLRFANEKEKLKKESELRQLLEDDELKSLLLQMGNENLNRAEKIQFKSLPLDDCKMSPDLHQEDAQNKQEKSPFPDIFCGAMSMPSFCVPGRFSRSQNEPEIPMEIQAGIDLDNFAIKTLISSVSESTDGSENDGKTPQLACRGVLRHCCLIMYTHLSDFCRTLRRLALHSCLQDSLLGVSNFTR
jgi:hypothetical protein